MAIKQKDLDKLDKVIEKMRGNIEKLESITSKSGEPVLNDMLREIQSTYDILDRQMIEYVNIANEAMEMQDE